MTKTLKDNHISAWEAFPVLINNGGFLSDAINVGGLRLFSICMPAAWTAANLTFQMSPDGGATWVDLKYQNGSEVMASAEVSTCIILDPSKYASLQYLRLRSGTADTPVVQIATRTLKLILRSV